MNPTSTRLLITANDADGRSHLSFDGAAPGTFVAERRPVAMTDLWHVDRVPADPESDGAGPAGRPFTIAPLDEGVVFRVVEFGPMTDAEREALDGSTVFAAMNAGDAHVETSVSKFMHRTRSVDFGIVLDGTMTMLLDDGAVEVSAGEIIVQRATNHAWENRSGAPATVAFVLIDADETGAR